MTTAALIAKSTHHLEAGDHGPALVAMLDAWRSHRSPRLAALVEVISDRAETTRPKVPGATTKARLAAARALLKAGDPVDLPRVIRTLADVKIAEATILAKALVVPPDPRFLRQIEALLRASPWGTSTSRTLWRILFDALVMHGDPRTASQLQAIELAPIIGNDWGTREMTKNIARLVAKLVEEEPASTPAIDAACTAAETIAKGQSAQGEALLANILAQPHDRALRAVYADWLQERGDVRGEYISLQLLSDQTDAQRRRERQLFELYGPDWLGGIPPAWRDLFRFTGGFASEVAIDPPRALATQDNPAWSTVESIWLWDQDAPLPRALLRSSVMRSLRFVGKLESHQLAGVAADRSWTIEGLGVSLPGYSRALTKREIGLVSALANLPQLHELAFDSAPPEAFDWLWKTPLGSKLTRLRVSSGLASVPQWIAATLPSHITSLQLSDDHGWHGWTVEVARGADGKLSRLTAILRPSWHDHPTSKVIELVEHLFEELAPDALEAFELRVMTSASKGDLAKVAAAAARQTRLKLEATGPVAPRVKDQRAARVRDAASAARTAYDTAARAIPAATKVLLALDLTQPATVAAVVKLLGGVKTTSGSKWAEVAYRLLALPEVKSSTALDSARAAAIDALVVLVPSGAARRITQLLDLEHGPWKQLKNELSMVPTAELGEVFDWFEARRGSRTSPRADEIYYSIINLATTRGTKATRADLRKRLRTNKKLTSFMRYAYEAAITNLS